MPPHDHSHAAPAGPPGAPDVRGKIAIAFAVTLTILLAQAIGTALTGSLALLTDTVHMVVDSSGLLVALVAATLVRRPSSPKHTWGYRRVEVLAALAQATVLAGTGVYVVVEAIGRFRKPPEMPSTILVAFGVVGLVGNVVSILVLASDRRSNLNMRAAFLEVANDALGSMSVIVAAIVIATTGWQRADAVAGLFIAALILPRAFKLIREAGAILMETTPRGLDLDEVREHMTRLEHVLAVHDLHASTVATGLPVISAHVVVDDGCFQDGHAIDILDDLRTCVAEHKPASRPFATGPTRRPGTANAPGGRVGELLAPETPTRASPRLPQAGVPRRRARRDHPRRASLTRPGRPWRWRPSGWASRPRARPRPPGPPSWRRRFPPSPTRWRRRAPSSCPRGR